MTKQELKQHVRDKLKGVEDRIKERQKARTLLTQKATVYRLRKNGTLESLAACRVELADRGIHYVEQQSWGMTVLHCYCGAQLAFDREGSISCRRRPPKLAMENRQASFISDELPVLACGPSSSALPS